MSWFLWIYLIASTLGALGLALHLGKMDYPRAIMRSAAEDVWSLILRIGFSVWVAWLLFNLPESP